jgi:membrane-bound lytic murein transglycosylase A
MRPGFGGAAVLAALALCGCAQRPSSTASVTFEPVRFDQIPGWPGDAPENSLTALKAECGRLARLPSDTVVGGQGIAAEAGGRAGDWSPACRAVSYLGLNDAKAAIQFYEAWFQAYRITKPALITGYYEPEVPGALSSEAGYTVPVLARPDDLVTGPPDPAHPGATPAIGHFIEGKFLPYWTRAEIEAGALRQYARPLLWLKSQSDLFFLQIQGAGRIRLPDGHVIRVAYAGKNGRDYTPIGAVLVAQHAMPADAVTMGSIKSWLAAHPGQAKAIMDRNEDYVFFRLLPALDAAIGPPGSLGVGLTAGRSAAVDPQYLPLGSPIFVDTSDPLSGRSWRCLLLAQDSATDIHGPSRTEIFFGFGAQAEQMAGLMRQTGIEYVLLPKRHTDLVLRSVPY